MSFEKNGCRYKWTWETIEFYKYKQIKEHNLLFVECFMCYVFFSCVLPISIHELIKKILSKLFILNYCHFFLFSNVLEKSYTNLWIFFFSIFENPTNIDVILSLFMTLFISYNREKNSEKRKYFFSISLFLNAYIF